MTHANRGSVTIVLVGMLLPSASFACPFCSAVSESFSEQMKTMDIVAIARMTSRQHAPTRDSDSPQEEVPLSTFEITNVLKGDALGRKGESFQLSYLGPPNANANFLVMAAEASRREWSVPLELTERAVDYLRALPATLSGASRLEFFQTYLEDEDEMLARDAYNEFARAPYSELVALKSKMNRQRLLEFVKSSSVPTLRRKLYFTMLGVCGIEEDARLLESFMTSTENKSGLDAMLACYVNLIGEEALDEIDRLFLNNPDAEYVDINAAVVAMRFHGNELDVIDRDRLIESIRYVLQNPSLADLVVDDLAKWQDWDSLPRLCELFQAADADSSFVRVPVLKYLFACPLPEAKERIEDFKRLDPDAFTAATISPGDALASTRRRPAGAIQVDDRRHAEVPANAAEDFGNVIKRSLTAIGMMGLVVITLALLRRWYFTA